MIKLAKTLKVIVAASVIFFSATALMAEESKSIESKAINQLCKDFSFNSEIANHDPFKPLINKKIVELIKIERQPEKAPAKEVKEVISPLKLKVTGICGNDGIREAVVQFENNDYIVKADQVVNGQFKIVDIGTNKVVVYSIKEARRATFALAEN